ncbi:thioredoxin [Panacibacter sp. DH6]|uniref:Thioredoxin n=1 Tax=Panacibacter microcysteis TaxID=2793269 RepID=A0A931E5J7_9BACT|nr:thioredoxin domain-containing protein [Panacibacter microcysteis]MBG9376577.1 thioredoxin [Panacibacter microcysteis]
MKNIMSLLLAVMLFSCSSNAQQGNKDVDATTFEKDIQKENVQVLDVRTPTEFADGHIKNAMLADWLNQAQFKERVQYLDKSKPVLVYCASGGRSSKASQWLADNGFTTVENLRGGITQWKIENKPVEGTSAQPQITEQDYAAQVNAAPVVLIDFGAAWCPPCRKMDPVISELETELKDKFRLVKIDGGIHTNMMKLQGVEALPTFIVYRNGKETWRKQGVIEKSELVAQLQ